MLYTWNTTAGNTSAKKKKELYSHTLHERL